MKLLLPEGPIATCFGSIRAEREPWGVWEQVGLCGLVTGSPAEWQMSRAGKTSWGGREWIRMRKTRATGVGGGKESGPPKAMKTSVTFSLILSLPLSPDATK